MSINTYQSLQTISRELASVPFEIVSLALGDPERSASISDYKIKLRSVRNNVILSLPALESQVQNIIGVPLLDFYADCALATAVATTLQRSLSEKLQGSNRNRALSQENTHLLVDLWGQIEASKALFDFSARQIAEMETAGGDKKIKGVSLRAQCRVLSCGLEQVLLTLARNLGDHLSLSAVAELVDWTVLQLRAPTYDGLRDAVNDELYGLVA